MTYLTEFIEADLAIKVFVGLNDGSVNELLKLDIREVVTNHHLEDTEEFTIGNVPIIVDIIDLESKSKLLIMTGASRERIQTLNEL